MSYNNDTPPPPRSPIKTSVRSGRKIVVGEGGGVVRTVFAYGCFGPSIQGSPRYRCASGASGGSEGANEAARCPAPSPVRIHEAVFSRLDACARPRGGGARAERGASPKYRTKLENYRISLTKVKNP